MINYLNQVTQSLNIAADIVGRVSSVHAGTLRTVAASAAVHADAFMRLYSRSPKNPTTGERFNTLKCPQMPSVILSDEDVDEVIKALQGFADAQKILSVFPDSAFVFSNTEERRQVERIKDSARISALLIERVLFFLTEGDQGPYFCSNCLEQHEEREDCSCGMSQAFLVPL